jgi:hypothetical protein
VSRRGNFTQIFQHAFFDLQTSNLLLVCQWKIIIYLLYIYIFCTKCSITHDTMTTSKPWVGSTGYHVKGAIRRT